MLCFIDSEQSRGVCAESSSHEVGAAGTQLTEGTATRTRAAIAASAIVRGAISFPLEVEKHADSIDRPPLFLPLSQS